MNMIHHIAIICSDKSAALEFYCEKLGFPVIRENYRPERDDWKIDLAMGDCELELFIMKGHPERPSPEAYGLRHLAFRVESVDETVAELAEKGIECEPRPHKLRIHSLPRSVGKAQSFRCSSSFREDPLRWALL